MKNKELNIWRTSLQLLKEYIDKNKKRPSAADKQTKIKILGCWISHQLKIYNTKIEIMKNDIIYNTWTDFINDNKYKKYFLDNNTNWLNTLKEVKKYVENSSDSRSIGTKFSVKLEKYDPKNVKHRKISELSKESILFIFFI
jgi:hypothetical protein